MDKWSDSTFLNKAKLAIQGKITRAALLLLGKEEASYLLNPAVVQISWILKDANNIELDYEHFSMPFIDLILQSIAKSILFLFII